MSRHVRPELDGPVMGVSHGVLQRPPRRIAGPYFRLLGPFEVVCDGQVVESGRRIQRLIVAILLLEANRVVSVERLVDLAWPDAPPRSARGSVQAYVSRVRAMLRNCQAEMDASIERVGSGYRLRLDETCVDAHRFVALVNTARTAEDAVAFPLFDEALALWRGQPLLDLAEEGVSARLCQNLCELREVAIEGRVEAALRLGRHGDLLPDLGAAVAEFPLRERLVELQMLALYRAGRRSEALGVFTGIRNRLAEDLGLDPGPGLIRLQQAVLRDDPALQAATATAGAQRAATVPVHIGVGAANQPARLAVGAANPSAPAGVGAAVATAHRAATSR